jgi:hypothetical protein
VLELVLQQTNSTITTTILQDTSGSPLQWAISNWFLLLSSFAALFTITAYTVKTYARWRRNWRKYCCRGLPSKRIFSSGKYGYDQKTFLKDIRSVDLALAQLRTWYTDGKPILLRGVAGIGKSRLVTEFIYSLSIWRRVWTRVLMPSPHEMNSGFPPFFKRGCILFLDNLHEFRDKGNDSKLEYYIKSNRFKVVATIPAEKYDPDWGLLTRFTWHEILVENWTPQEGRRLAQTKGMKFTPSEFKGTPLSILAPDAELTRSYDLLSPGGKAVLRALKIIKTHLGCFADYDLISAIQSSDSKFEYSDFLNIISKKAFWCKIDDSKCMLADESEGFVQYDVSMNDAYRLQLVLMGRK